MEEWGRGSLVETRSRPTYPPGSDHSEARRAGGLAMPRGILVASFWLITGAGSGRLPLY